MSTSIAAGTLVAMERIVSVLQANLATELATMKADLGLAGLPLPAPDVEAYNVTMSADRSTYTLRNNRAQVWVYQSGPSTFPDFESSNLMTSPATFGQYRLLKLGVSLVFGLVSSEPFERTSKILTSRDIMAYRGILYAGAIETVVRKYACCNDASILDVHTADDFAGSFIYQPDGEPIEGTASVGFDITQQLLIERC